MSGIKKFRRLRVQWKILLSVLVVLGAFSGYMVFANADSSVTVTVKSYKTAVPFSMIFLQAVKIFFSRCSITSFARVCSGLVCSTT